MIKIISGERRGTKLQTLDGLDTRPLRARIREALFSIIRPNLPDAVVWDLFAGSGGVGLESLSGGASKALFAESSPQAIQIINANIERLRYRDQTTVIRGDLPESLKFVPRDYRSPDIIFMMPPYKSGLVEKVLTALENPDFAISPEALIIVETHRKEPDIDLNNWEITDDRQYGITRLTFFQLKQSQ